MSQGDFEFQPPDRRRLWQSLALTMSQASSLTGVSERQIQHWMDRGYIVPTGRDRKINGRTLEQIILIGQARTAGIPLRRAVALAHDYLRSEAFDLDTEVSTGVLQDLEDRLVALRDGVDNVHQIVLEIERRDRTVDVYVNG